MTIDHYGRALSAGNVIEILPIQLLKTELSWYRKIVRLRKRSRKGTITSVSSANNHVLYLGTDGMTHEIPSRYVKKVS